MLRYYVVATCLLGLTSAKLTKVADITTKAHGVAGTLYAKDAKHLVIKGFTYDGAGPDAFFWVGTDGSPGRHGAVVLPYPFTGKFYEYEDPDTPKLEPGTSYDGSVDIELKFFNFLFFYLFYFFFKFNRTLFLFVAIPR